MSNDRPNVIVTKSHTYSIEVDGFPPLRFEVYTDYIALFACNQDEPIYVLPSEFAESLKEMAGLLEGDLEQ